MASIKKFKRGFIGGKTSLVITSPYGWRIHPRTGRRRFHHGNDIAIPQGTPIYAPCDGTIQQKQQNKGAGLYLVLSADSGYNFYFMHLHSVNKTGRVKEGDLIATSGGAVTDGVKAGSSTGAHLHFEARKGSATSTSIDSRIWISDNWVGRRTGRTIVSNNSNMPLISKKTADYSDDEKAEVEFDSDISDDEIDISRDYDSSSETDWAETEEIGIDDETDVFLDRTFTEDLTSGIWQIVKLAMDSDVADLRIRDAATSLQQGSLINFFQKVCQQPFVEFFGDTFGDQYYFIVRRPPTDKEGMWKTMNTQGLFNQSEDDLSVVATTEDTIYDIYENQLISSNISFNTQNIYSWYQFFPIYELGSPNDLQYIIPAILFPEYAAIWGSRSLTIRSQYRNFLHSGINDKVKNGEKTEQCDIEVRHSIKDLKFLIESNAYAPFVRQGTIQLFGNRKIKRGTFIRLHWNALDCGEIFYVENVTQNYSVGGNSVQRSMTLNLSRGMLEDYMFNTSSDRIIYANESGEVTKSTKISYFNLIDFGEYEQYKDKLDMDKWREIISKWKVNIDVFKFFLRKMQISSKIKAAEFEAVKQIKIM